MTRLTSSGMSLVELLVAMAIASIVGGMILQLVFSYQSRVFAEIGRNDLQDRAERLVRFLANDIREAGFLVGAQPVIAEGSPLSLVHDSLPGVPLENLPFAILAHDGAENDRVTIVKGVSFSPPLLVEETVASGTDDLVLSRRPNRPPGSSRELLPSPEAINHLVFENHGTCYPVEEVDATLFLDASVVKTVPAGTEVLGVRALIYQLDPFAGTFRLRRDDFTSRDILDDAIDGLQFEFLLKDGSLVHAPTEMAEVRGVRVSLLVRDLRADRSFVNDVVYTLGNRSYGPFRDHYRRTLVARLVEVKNHAL